MSRVLIIDDTDPNIIYTGDWRNVSLVGTFSNEYMNTTKKSATPGDAISYRWAGKQISVYGTLDEPAIRGSPNAKFSIDGGPGSVLNSTGAVIPATPTNITSHVLLYQSPVLTQGVHTISITILPSSFVGAGAAPSFYFDFFTTATDCVAPFSNVIVDDTDRSVEYRGTWDDVVNATDYMQTSRRVANGSATFRFYGKEVAVFGTPPRLSTKSVIFEGLGSSSRVSSTTRPYPHTRLFFNNSLLDTEEHSLVMRNYYSTSSTLTDTRSTSFDYLIYNIGRSAAAGVSDSCIPAESANKAGIIAGGVVGVVALVLIIVGAVFFFKRRREKLAAKTNNAGRDPGIPPAFVGPYNGPIVATSVDPAQQNPYMGPGSTNYAVPYVSPTWTTPIYPSSQSSSYAPSSVPQQWAPPAHAAPPTLPYSPQTEVTTPDSGKARFSYIPEEGVKASPWSQQQKLEQVDQDVKSASPPSYADHR